MKVEVSKSYVASDGTKFDDKTACEQHELANVFKPLLNLKQEALDDMLAGTTDKGKMLADLVEKLAVKLRAARIERGELKRPPRKAAEPASAPQQNAA